jgi:hypothetical protein
MKIRAVARHKINDDKRAEDRAGTEIKNLNQSLTTLSRGWQDPRPARGTNQLQAMRLMSWRANLGADEAELGTEIKQRRSNQVSSDRARSTSGPERSDEAQQKNGEQRKNLRREKLRVDGRRRLSRTKKELSMRRMKPTSDPEKKLRLELRFISCNSKAKEGKQIALTRCKDGFFIEIQQDYNESTEFTTLPLIFDWKLKFTLGSLLI